MEDHKSFALPFPGVGYKAETGNQFATYRCQPGPKTWVSVVFSSDDLCCELFFYDTDRHNNCNQSFDYVEICPLLITALIHNFLITSKVTTDGQDRTI